MKEDSEECIRGLFSRESKESIMGISRGEREQRILGTRPSMRIAWLVYTSGLSELQGTEEEWA